MAKRPISAPQLFEAIASNATSASAKLDAINDLKTHVKKDLVDLSQVPKYFEALSIGVDIHDAGIAAHSFSVLCHLVKRVGMQDKSGDLLRRQSYLILPIIVSRMGDSKNATKSSAKKALEAYWFSAAHEVETVLRDIALCHRNPQIVAESVTWLDHIIRNVNSHFDLTPLLAPLVESISRNSASSHEEVVQLIVDLLSHYYQLKHNRLYKYDLSKELDSQNVKSSLKLRIENALGVAAPVLTPAPVASVPDEALPQQLSSSRNPTIEIKPNSRNPSIESRPENSVHAMSSPPPSTTAAASSDIDAIIHTLSNYSIDDSVSPKDVDNDSELLHITRGLLPAFNSKETEHNWSRRERAMITLRELVRGNAPTAHLDAFIAGLKEMADGICKAVLSLRTTLSSHACHFMKELALTLGSVFDVLVEYFLPALIKLTSMPKNIASSNANVALCAIFINCTYNSRILQRVYNSAIEKNTRTRAFSALWLQIIIVRFHKNPNFLAHHGSVTSGYSHFVSCLAKLLGDPNPTVRLAAKDTYWSFANYFPVESSKLLAKLEPNVLRAIERSRPQGNSRSNFRFVSSETSNRPSAKGAIITKHRELRQKQRLEASSRAASRPVSRQASERSFSSKHEEQKPTESNLHRSRSMTLGSVHSQTSQKLGPKSVNGLSRSEHAPIADNADINMHQDYHKETSPNDQNAFAKSKTVPVTTIRKRSSEFKDTQSSPSKYEDFTNTFNKQQDPIPKFLSSNDSGLVREGINLLKYAIKGGEDFPNEVKDYLLAISKNDVAALKPLFTSKDLPLNKVFEFFEPHDFFRVCSLVIEPIDATVCDSIIALFELDDVYSSISSLLAYCFDIEGLIGGDNALAIQAIKYKSTIVRALIEFMLISSNKIPISDKHYSSIVSSLFELVNLLKSTVLYSSFSELLRKLYSINQVLFLNELDTCETSVKEEVGYIVDLEGLTEFHSGGNKEFTTSNFLDLTKVMPNNYTNTTSPFKGTSDLTMLMPVSGGDDLAFRSVKMKKPSTIAEDKMEVDDHRSIRSTVFTESKFELDGSISGSMSSTKDENVFLEKPVKGDLIDNFAAVKISDKSKTIEKDALQSFVDIIDPLKKLSDKAKPIDIYEDPNSRGSPVKPRHYDYSNFNWFNFKVAGLASIDAEVNKQEFVALCSRLGNNTIQGKEFLLLLHYLQSTHQFDMDFTNFFYVEGQKQIQSSLWRFLEQHRSLNRSRVLSGLIIFKQILLNGTKLNLPLALGVLVELSSNDDDIIGELGEAISEIFDEMTCLYHTEEMLNGVLSEVRKLETNDTEGKLVFLFDCVVKMLSNKSISDYLDEAVLKDLDGWFQKFVNHRQVRVRRLVILGYSRLGLYDSDKAYGKLNTSQRKLVEYYSRV